MLTLHASCVAINGRALLLRGPSGAGKSDLALRLIDDGARLVADDRTLLRRDSGGLLLASAPPAIRGLIEVRGIGPVRFVPAPATPVFLLLDLVAPADVPRLPDPVFETFLDVPIPRLAFDPFAASAVVKARLALDLAAAGTLFEPAEAANLAGRP